MPITTPPMALAFDVFGTIVDWRTSIAREAKAALATIERADIDAFHFADEWRARYIPAMMNVIKGKRGFVKLDVLHREMLDEVLAKFDISYDQLDEAGRVDLTYAWHRLDPWPDSVAGLTRLKARFPIVTLSNGNIALMVNMARRAGLPWDAILGAEIAQNYKPDPKTYQATAAALDLAPDQLCLVAAHHGDLSAGRAAGLQSAFVSRPMEYGGRTAPDAHMGQDWEYSASDLLDLADQLGC